RTQLLQPPRRCKDLIATRDDQPVFKNEPLHRGIAIPSRRWIRRGCNGACFFRPPIPLNGSVQGAANHLGYLQVLLWPRSAARAAWTTPPPADGKGGPHPWPYGSSICETYG